MNWKHLTTADLFSEKSVEIITGDLGTRQLPPFPRGTSVSGMILHDGEILLLGSQEESDDIEKCFKFKNDFPKLEEHSILTCEWRRSGVSSAVTTEKATFVFGGLGVLGRGRGFFGRTTYEYLPKNCTEWKKGRISIPGGFHNGCAIAIKSGQEILLIGGNGTEKRILKFNTNDHTFEELSAKLNEKRIGSRCAIIPGTNKVIITGGATQSLGRFFLNSTEIFDPQDDSITMASKMNFRRGDHGIGLITINDKEQLVVFGGGLPREREAGADSVEVYNADTGTWEISSIKLKNPPRDFAYLSVRLGDIIPKL